MRMIWNLLTLVPFLRVFADAITVIKRCSRSLHQCASGTFPGTSNQASIRTRYRENSSEVAS